MKTIIIETKYPNLRYLESCGAVSYGFYSFETNKPVESINTCRDLALGDYMHLVKGQNFDFKKILNNYGLLIGFYEGLKQEKIKLFSRVLPKIEKELKFKTRSTVFQFQIGKDGEKMKNVFAIKIADEWARFHPVFSLLLLVLRVSPFIKLDKETTIQSELKRISKARSLPISQILKRNNDDDDDYIGSGEDADIQDSPDQLNHGMVLIDLLFAKGVQIFGNPERTWRYVENLGAYAEYVGIVEFAGTTHSSTNDDGVSIHAVLSDECKIESNEWIKELMKTVKPEAKKEKENANREQEARI